MRQTSELESELQKLNTVHDEFAEEEITIKVRIPVYHTVSVRALRIGFLDAFL